MAGRAPRRRVRLAQGPRRSGRRGGRLRHPRRAGSRSSASAGWIGLGWPVEHGGRGAIVDQQIIWAEEYARAEAPARVNHMGENLLAPDADRLRHRRAAGPVPPRHPRRHRALVPGLQRAERRVRPGQRADHGRVPRRRRVGHQRPEGVDLARPRLALVLRRRPHRARLAAPPGARRSSSSRWTSRASRCARSSRSPAAASSTRCSSTTPAPRPSLVVGEPGDGLEDRDGPARLRARDLDARPAGRLRA